MPIPRAQIRPRRRPPVHFLPLGGCGEIGMNLSLYGYQDAWIAVDCGMLIRQDLPGEPLQVPDTSILDTRGIRPQALLITHGHEDHIGAAAWLWPRWACPILATPLVAAMLRVKFSERGLPTDAIDVIEPGDARDIAGFSLRFLPLTHSIPESCALLIQAGNSRILHTGDWKLDPEPLIGQPVNEDLFRALAPVDLVVGDSTNANVAGHSRSEGEVARAMVSTISRCQGRVVVSCFASNLARVLAIGRAAARCGRRVSLLGRSMERMVGHARQLGYLDDFPALVPVSDLGYLPPEEVLVIATGSQGEPRAALSRLAQGRHPHFELTTGDTVIFSAKAIPGNEHLIERLKRGLARFQVTIIDDASHPELHASGHPAQQELERFYRWLQPTRLLPVHGEENHQSAHQELACRLGIEAPLAPRNGDLIRFDQGGLTREESFPLSQCIIERGGIDRRQSPAHARNRHGVLFLAISLVATDTGWARIGRLMIDSSQTSPLDEDNFIDWLDEQLDDLAVDTLSALRRGLYPRIQAWLGEHLQRLPQVELQLMASDIEGIAGDV